MCGMPAGITAARMLLRLHNGHVDVGVGVQLLLLLASVAALLLPVLPLRLQYGGEERAFFLAASGHLRGALLGKQICAVFHVGAPIWPRLGMSWKVVGVFLAVLGTVDPGKILGNLRNPRGAHLPIARAG